MATRAQQILPVPTSSPARPGGGVPLSPDLTGLLAAFLTAQAGLSVKCFPGSTALDLAALAHRLERLGLARTATRTLAAPAPLRAEAWRRRERP